MWKGDELAVDATGYTGWFVEQIIDRVSMVVVDTHQFKVIRKSVKKTDKHDAKTLAFFLSKDMLPEARMRSKEKATVPHGRITRSGLKIGRTTLIQCTLAAKQYSPYLRRYYERIECCRGRGKAIGATARKFLGIIYQKLNNDWAFEDFPNFIIVNT